MIPAHLMAEAGDYLDLNYRVPTAQEIEASKQEARLMRARRSSSIYMDIGQISCFRQNKSRTFIVKRNDESVDIGAQFFQAAGAEDDNGLLNIGLPSFNQNILGSALSIMQFDGNSFINECFDVPRGLMNQQALISFDGFTSEGSDVQSRLEKMLNMNMQK